MKKRMKSLLAAVMVFAMLAAGMMGIDTHVKAEVGDPKIIEGTEFTVTPGEKSHIKMTVEATTFMFGPEVNISAAGGLFTFSKPKMSIGVNGFTTLAEGTQITLEFDVTPDDSVKIGTYPVKLEFTYYGLGSDFGPDSTPTIRSIFINLKVNQEKEPAQLTISNVRLSDTNIGSKTSISFTVKNEGGLVAKNTFTSIDFGSEIIKEYSAVNIKIGDLAPGDTKDLTLPVSIKPDAATGRKTLSATFSYKTTAGDPLTSTYNFYVNLTSAATTVQNPKLSIEEIKCGDGLKPGDNFNISVKLENIGGAEARNILVTVDASSIGPDSILKDYYTEGISVDTMKKDANTSVDIPLTVSKYATGGLKPVKIVVTYTDAAGLSYTLNDTAYVDVIAAISETGSPNLIVSNVTQNPAQPVAGEKVEISFDLENRSNVDISEFKIAPTGLTEATFIPVNSDPYQYYEMLKAGDKLRVTIPLIVSKYIPEGLNNLTISYSYAGSKEATPSFIIPVKDIQNDIGSISKPKLIVSQYYADVNELRAGSEFNFTFDLKNTNAAVAAKNITVSVTQPDNIFTVTQGSNSLYISNIGPGETVSSTLPMKVKADAATGIYQLKVLIEYEYDGLEPNPQTGEIDGESKTIDLNLQAVENSRPVVDNVNVYSFDGMVSVGNPATLSMEFYNMGKSPLNNVAVTVEGDFMKADGSMYFIGNVQAGSSTYAEFEVMPNIEGEASGLLRVTFEDSNGNTVEFTKDFKTQVMPAGGMIFDPNQGGDGSGEVFNPDAVTAKKAILPLWMFIIINVVIFILFIPITRKVIITVYRSKLRRKEEEQYYRGSGSV